MKVHLGCGKRYLPGYMHIDILPYDHVDYAHDARSLPMFKDCSIDIIYASHLLEHFLFYEVGDILQEWKRVLVPGGLLRLAVPDFEKLVTVYLTYKDLDLIIGPLYGRGNRVQGCDETSHKFITDFTTIKKLLEINGFEEVQRWDWRKVFVGDCAGFDDFSQSYIPHMDKENGILISLNVEAKKVKN